MSVSGALIREARRRAGLSQAALGRRLGKPQSVIARWERGRATPSLDTLLEVIRACGLELEYRLVPRDASNLSLIEQHLRMTPAERLAQNTHMVNLIDGARRLAASRDG